VSNLGDGVDVVALPLLAASLTDDPLLVALVAFARSGPWLLFALVSGALVDRGDRRRIMWRSDVVRCILLAGLAATVVADRSHIVVLYVVAFGLGTAETLFDNAAQAVLPALVDGHALETANGRMYAAEVVTNQFAGPPLGGLLFAAAMAAPLVLDAASFLAAAALVASIRGSYRPNAGGRRRRLRAEIAEGVRWLWRHRLLRVLALALGASNMSFMAGEAILVLFARRELGLGAAGFGTLMAAGAAGSLAGGLTASRITAALGRARVLLVAALIIPVVQFGIGLTSSALVVGALLAGFGFAAVTWNVVTVSLRQAIVPAAVLGRVNSVYRFLGWGSIPVGALLGGVLSRAVDLRAPFLAGGVVSLMVAGAIALWVDEGAIAAARADAPAMSG
jgi:MFS family permease